MACSGPSAETAGEGALSALALALALAFALGAGHGYDVLGVLLGHTDRMELTLALLIGSSLLGEVSGLGTQGALARIEDVAFRIPLLREGSF